MKEWTNQWNPFNSAKALLHREHFEACAKQDFLPPVTVSTDPSNRCNFDCIWCNAFEMMQKKCPDLSEDHLLRLADLYAEWGVKTTCVAGGGEPFMNQATGKFLLRLKENGVGCAPVTNGSLLTDELIEIIAKTCRWCGISVDVCYSDTYMKIKGISDSKIFGKVLDNIAKLTKHIRETDSDCEVGYKYLLHPLNSREIYYAAELAKSLGVNDFQLRPVGWDNIYKTKSEHDIYYTPSMLDSINSQIEAAMSLENENFHVYGIRHKFRPDFQRKVNFKKCWASPIATLTFGADGNCYLCLDMRGREDMILCSHFDILKYWNSDRHKKMLQNIDPLKCPRCTIGPYNEIVEQVFIEDRMCRDFL